MPAPPSGVVTLVVTDIEGSTSAWERLGTRFRAALDVHDHIVRDAIVDHGGTEVRSGGDGFVVAFEDPRDAVGFAIAVQELLHAAEWPSEVVGDDPTIRGLRVRMGVHRQATLAAVDEVTGRPTYPGALSDVAERVTRAAHGGQVLATAAVRDGIAGSGPFVDLGEHDVGDGATAHLWQVVPPALGARRFPPPRSRPVEQTNVWPDVTSFLGRDADLARVDAAFAGGARIVTITGTAGTGKTRLARVYARRRFEAGPDQVWFVDLAEARTPADVAVAVRGVLGLAGGDGSSLDDVALALLRRGPTLLVLDDAESIAGPAAQAAERWTSRARDLSVLATSRIPLDAAGESVVPLDPLEVATSPEDAPRSAAVALFLDRARAARHDFHPGPADWAAIAEIVRRVDGLPLAIELAAARMRSVTPERLVGLLDRGGALSSNRRDAAARHASLERAIAVSWELLHPWERDAMAQLGVFVGAFSGADAEAVLALTPDAPPPAEIVDGLAEQSLLRRVPPDRYTAYAAVRDHALVRLTDSERRAAEVRHGRRFARLATPGQILHADAPGGLRALATRYRADLLAACERAIERGDGDVAHRTAQSWLAAAAQTGPFEEAARLGERAAALPGDEVLVSAILSHCAYQWLMAGRFDQSDRIAGTVLERARHLGSKGLAGGAYTLLASARKRSGDLDAAERLYREAITAWSEPRRTSSIASGVANLAGVLLQRGRYVESEALLQDALATHRQVGNRRSEGICLGNIGRIRRDSGELDRALALFEEAAAIHAEVGNRMFEVSDLLQLAGVHADLHDDARALEVSRRALRAADAAGEPRLRVIALLGLAHAERRTGERDAARARVDEVEPWLQMLAPGDRASVHLARAHQHVADGRPADALPCFDRALDGLDRISGVLEAVRALQERALAALAAGRPDEALETVRRAEAAANACDLPGDAPVHVANAEIRARLAAHPDRPDR